MRTGILCLASALLILSDCVDMLGSWAFNLKYGGVVLLGLLCVYDAVTKGVDRRKLVLGLIALALLVGIMPFQTGSFSAVQATGLFLAVFALACLSSSVIESPQQLIFVFGFCVLLIVILLIISHESVASQFRLYLNVGRPRIKGCFSNPNSLGNIAAMLCMGIACCGFALPKKSRKVVTVLFVASAVLVLASGSRTALITVGGFFASYWFASLLLFRKDIRMRYLLILLALVVLAILVYMTSQLLANDQPFLLRIRSLQSITIGSPQSFVGLGYVSSQGSAQLGAAAGGVTDMLYVSLFYRVGLIGMLAYALFVAGAVCGPRGKGSSRLRLTLAILVALLFQSFGESYFSSVMSFVSCFDWIALSSFPNVVAQMQRAKGKTCD